MDKKELLKQLRFYKGKYFIGFIENSKGQFLHYNKKGFELRNGLSPKAVIFNYDNAEHTKRFDTLANSPFKHCYKIDCNQYLYGYNQPENWFTKLINFLRKIWSR